MDRRCLAPFNRASCFGFSKFSSSANVFFLVAGNIFCGLEDFRRRDPVSVFRLVLDGAMADGGEGDRPGSITGLFPSMGLRLLPTGKQPVLKRSIY